MSKFDTVHARIPHRDVTTWVLSGLLLATIAVISVNDGIIEKVAQELTSAPATVRQPEKIGPKIDRAAYAPEVLPAEQQEQARSILKTADEAHAMVKNHARSVQSRSGACGQAARDGHIPATARAQWECMLGVGPYSMAVNKRAEAMAEEATDR